MIPPRVLNTSDISSDELSDSSGLSASSVLIPPLPTARVEASSSKRSTQKAIVSSAIGAESKQTFAPIRFHRNRQQQKDRGHSRPNQKSRSEVTQVKVLSRHHSSHNLKVRGIAPAKKSNQFQSAAIAPNSIESNQREASTDTIHQRRTRECEVATPIGLQSNLFVAHPLINRPSSQPKLTELSEAYIKSLGKISKHKRRRLHRQLREQNKQKINHENNTDLIEQLKEKYSNI